jgi:hypothetical protein
MEDMMETMFLLKVQRSSLSKAHGSLLLREQPAYLPCEVLAGYKPPMEAYGPLGPSTSKTNGEIPQNT